MNALANEDRLPHDRAVWRRGNTPPTCEGFRAVTVDYGGVVESTFVDKAAWTHVVQWRFGWEPRS